MSKAIYNWYVIKTKPRNEKKVASDFERMGWVHQLPLRRELRQWKDRKKWVNFPLFPSYVFLYLESSLKNEVYTFPGVLGFLKIGAEIATIKQEEIERIKRICESGLTMEVNYEPLSRGDEIEIMQGPLKGLQGIVSETANGAKINIRVEALSCTISVNMENTFLKKLSN